VLKSRPRHTKHIEQEGKYSLESTDFRESEIRAPPQPIPYLMPIRPNTLFYNKKNYHSLFVARTWQHFIDLLKRKNPRFTAFLDSNAYIKLAPNSARPVRRLPPALGTGAGPAAAGRAGALALALRARPWPCGPRARPWPVATPRLALHCEKTRTYLRRAYVSVYRYSLEVFPVSRTGKTMTNKVTFFG